jgi:subtilase family serine protease
VAAAGDTVLGKADLRPDFQVEFVRVDDGKAGTPLTYTVQVRNEGDGSGAATVSTIVPPELSNVRVTAPGFACTRRFSASGPQAGTVVSCTRSELDAGASAEMTIEANAPSAAAVYQLTATADPRDEIAETDESNNEADATIRVRA